MGINITRYVMNLLKRSISFEGMPTANMEGIIIFIDLSKMEENKFNKGVLLYVVDKNIDETTEQQCHTPIRMIEDTTLK